MKSWSVPKGVESDSGICRELYPMGRVGVVSVLEVFDMRPSSVGIESIECFNKLIESIERFESIECFKKPSIERIESIECDTV